MRKTFILAALLTGAVVFSGMPAKAWVGCTCVKLGSPAVCTSGPGECTLKNGGACVLPCDYQQPKKANMHKKKSKEA
ncbi:MAG: hypothetical protein WB540_12805 [Pseudolabrys sp.]|jgi:hypothetical protein